jgi:hypothetical protein
MEISKGRSPEGGRGGAEAGPTGPRDRWILGGPGGRPREEKFAENCLPTSLWDPRGPIGRSEGNSKQIPARGAGAGAPVGREAPGRGG